MHINVVCLFDKYLFTSTVSCSTRSPPKVQLCAMLARHVFLSVRDNRRTKLYSLSTCVRADTLNVTN